MKRTAKVPLTFLIALTGTLVLAQVASAHAHVSPPVVLAKQSQVFTLAVPTEKEGATTTQIVLTPPQGFNIDSFVPSPGWERKVQQSGSGEDAVVTKVTWTGGKVPTGEDAAFSFLASAADAKTYTFGVQQTYSDGSVVDWNGDAASDTPAPTVEAVDSLGGGGGGSSDSLAIAALAVGGIGVMLGVVALVRGSGRELA